jgi:hypothetical protein
MVTCGDYGAIILLRWKSALHDEDRQLFNKS